MILFCPYACTKDNAVIRVITQNKCDASMVIASLSLSSRAPSSCPCVLLVLMFCFDARDVSASGRLPARGQHRRGRVKVQPRRIARVLARMTASARAETRRDTPQLSCARSCSCHLATCASRNTSTWKSNAVRYACAQAYKPTCATREQSLKILCTTPAGFKHVLDLSLCVGSSVCVRVSQEMRVQV